jgi:hypothetical protein
MALAAYTPQPHKFNRFNKDGLFGRDKTRLTKPGILGGFHEGHWSSTTVNND